METGSVSAISIILWILAANAILILSTFGLVSWWRSHARESIAKISEQIRELDDRMGQLGEFLRLYGGIDQEPFFTPLQELQKEAGEIQARLQTFLETCRAFEEELNTPGPNHLQSIINAPFVWFRRWRKSIELTREGEITAEQITAAEQRTEQIYELPWELASECRQASQEVNEYSGHVQWLQSHNLRDITFQKVASQAPVIQQSLDRLPPVFLQAGKEELLAAANLQTTIQVFNALSSLRPALNRYLPQVRDWHANLEKAIAGYTELKQAGASLRQALSSPPSGLVVTPLQARLDQVAQLATDINQQLAQPEADALKLLAREVTQLHKVLQDSEQQFARAGKQLSELSQALADLQSGLDKLSAQMTSLQSGDRYPLAWDESSAQLASLRQKLHGIGPAQQPRTPEQIQQHSIEVEALRPAYTQLAEKVPQAVKQHGSLAALLENPEIRDGAAWLKKAQETVAAAAVYDARNWPKKEAPQTLLSTLEEMNAMQAARVPADAKTPLKESDLSERLKDTQDLAGLHKDLRPRVEAIHTRLEKLRTLESEGKDRLTGSWSILEKVALLSESNALLDEIIAEDIDRLGEEIRQLGNEINAHDQGEIEKKAQRIQLQAEKVSQALNQWLATLGAAAAEQAKQISDRLIEVDAIARLDDLPVENARSLLQSDEVNFLRGGFSPQPAQNVVGKVTNRLTRAGSPAGLNDLDAFAEIKRKNDLWQALSTTYKALEEKCAPFLASHQEALQARTKTRERMAEVARHFTDKRAWPPHNQSPLAENQLIQPVDERWEALRKKPSHADWAILELGRLTQHYRLAEERANQALNRIQQDQERIQDLETQVDSLKQRWQAQVEPGKPILREGIQQLLSQADSKLAFVKQQFMRGTLTYEQAIKNLQLLYDELFSAQVAADDQNKVGLR